MLVENSYRNPFSDYNANTMDSEQITDFWENPFENYVLDITEKEVASERKPLVFTGGRGTGKTMLLKHFDLSSEIVRAQKEGKELKEYILENGYIGVYIRFDSPLLRGFDGLGLNNEKWEVIFTHFFEMTVAKAYIDALYRLQEKRAITEEEGSKILDQIKEIVPMTEDTVISASKWFKKEINYVNSFRANIVFDEVNFLPQKLFTSGMLSSEIVKIVKEICPELAHINILVLLDEYENFLEYEQRIVNSIIKLSDNIAFRVGMRPMGFHTFDTVSENEFIKEKRDYRNILLENPLIKKEGDGAGYILFLKGIAEKRLSSVPCFAEKGMIDLSSFLGEKEDPVSEANKIVKGRKKHIDVYLNEIERTYKKRKEKFRITKEQLEKLLCDENPLYEMQNMRMLLKPYPVDFVIKAYSDYCNGVESDECKKYANDYVNKYKLAYVFVLRSIYRVESKQYYGVTDFAYLSSGIAGTFIELCRCAFQYAFFSEKAELFLGHISPEIQTKAARDVGKSELDQVKRISKVGNYVYNLAINLGRRFIVDHIDKRIKYPETNQFSFNSRLLENKSKEDETFQAAVMWSVIQKKKDLQQAGIGKDDEEVYVLNRIFAPVFNISVRTRGGNNPALDAEKFKSYLSEEDAIESFDNEEDIELNSEDEFNQLDIFDIMLSGEDDGE